MSCRTPPGPPAGQKAAATTHRTVQANVVGAAVFNGVTPAAVSLATLPFFHVTGMEHSMNAPIYTGGPMVLMTRWDRETAAELIERHRVTHWTNISTMVVDFLADPEIENRDLSSLALVGGGGAALPTARRGEARKADRRPLRRRVRALGDHKPDPHEPAPQAEAAVPGPTRPSTLTPASWTRRRSRSWERASRVRSSPAARR